MSSEQNPSGNAFGANQIVKHQSSSSNLNASALVTTESTPRKSRLKHPNYFLGGHSESAAATRFDPTGEILATGSSDKTIRVFHTFGETDNYLLFKDNKKGIRDLQFSRDSSTLYSASDDEMVSQWDLETGTRVRRHRGHYDIVHSVVLSRRGAELLITASLDGYVGIWDPRHKYAIHWIATPEELPVVAVAVPEAGNEIYSAGIDGQIHVWDMRTHKESYTLFGHTDTITSLEVSPDSQYLLSQSYDSTVRTWDIRPFAPTDRSVKTYDGFHSGLEKCIHRASWDNDGKRIAAGSGDNTVVMWDVDSGRILNKLGGHKGPVNDVRFCPSNSSVMLSGAEDGSVILGELPE